MSKAIAARLARLEQATGDRIVIVWCDDPEGMDATIADMLASGEADRGDTFIHWQSATAGGRVHAAALMELDG